MKIYLKEAQTQIAAPLDEVFDFFSRAENLGKLTPDFLQFKILSPLPLKMEPGSLIDYRIRLMGVSFKWRTEITVWEPPHRFVDNQLKGPYRMWLHEHRFEAVEGGTLMHDRVQYAVPGWIFAPVVLRLFVRSRVDEIFAFRQEAIQRIFANK